MLTQRIFHWADQTPDRLAVDLDGRGWSYAAFARHIAIARGWFADRGWIGGGIAVLAIRKLIDFWVLSLALRSLGVTTFAATEPAVVARLSLPDVRGVVTSPAEDWPGLEAACAEAGLTLAAVSLQGGRPLDLGAGPRHAFAGHILETSGTTGEFKQVLMDPAFEAAFLARRLAVNGIDRGSVVAAFSFPVGSGVGYKSPAGAWTVGASILLRQDGRFTESLAHPGLTHATMTPLLLATLLALPGDAFPFNPDLVLSVTGGALTRPQIDATKARLSPHLVSGLGATESHFIARTRLDTPDDQRWHVPAPGSVVQIVDDDDRPVPVGQTGRLRVDTTDGPTRYLNDEDATRQFFKDGFFYSGDLAVWREDGRFALQGRVTDVINIEGRKVSPAPIEERLREALGVSGVCLFSRQDDAGEEEVHVVIESPAPLPMDALTAALKRELQGFPRARVRYVAALPRNAMGKMVRRAVRA